MPSVINKPIHRLFVDLDPAAFTREFNAMLSPARARLAPPRTRSQATTWHEQQAEVRALLRLWDHGGADARAALSRRLNVGLNRFVTLKTLPTLKALTPFSRDAGMLGIVWLHMARVLIGQSVEATCAMCGTVFIPSRAGRARFCKPYCRLKHHRQQAKR